MFMEYTNMYLRDTLEGGKMSEKQKNYKTQFEKDKQVMKDIFKILKLLTFQEKRDLYHALKGMQLQKAINQILPDKETV